MHSFSIFVHVVYVYFIGNMLRSLIHKLLVICYSQLVKNKDIMCASFTRGQVGLGHQAATSLQLPD